MIKVSDEWAEANGQDLVNFLDNIKDKLNVQSTWNLIDVARQVEKMITEKLEEIRQGNE